MKSNGSVVTYLVFEFFIPACFTYEGRSKSFEPNLRTEEID